MAQTTRATFFGAFVSSWTNKMPHTMVEASLVGPLKHVAEMAHSPLRSPRYKKLDPEQQEEYNRELAARMQRHSQKFDQSKPFLHPGNPEEHWNVLKFDQSVNLVCLAEYQIDHVLIFEQCLGQDATVNRSHPLFSLPTAIRMKIYSFLIPATTRKITLSPAFATKHAFGEDFFDDPFTTLQHVCGALEAFQAIRHELTTYFWTQFHFHVTLTPFTGPKFSPLSSIWFMENLAIVQHLTLEVDLTKFGGGFMVGAAEYGYQMGATDRLLTEISSGLSKRRGTTIMTDLNLLCRRYAGNRPPTPVESDIFSCSNMLEALTKKDYKDDGFAKRLGAADVFTGTNSVRRRKVVKQLEAFNQPLMIEPTPKEADKIPYCPELPTLVCDSIRMMAGLVQRCRMSGFTQAYTELLLTSLFEQEGEVLDCFIPEDWAWPMLPTPKNDIESVFPRTKLWHPGVPVPNLSREPSFLRLRVGNLAASARNTLSIAGSALGSPRYSSAPSPKVPNFDTNSRAAHMATDLDHLQKNIHSPGLKSKRSLASTVSTPGSPIATTEPITSAHLHRSFSSSGLKYSSVPVTTSPLSHDSDSPAVASFRSPPPPATPRTPAFPRSRLSLRSSVRSPTAPHTPDTSYFPLMTSAVPSRSVSPGTPPAPFFGPYTNLDAVHPAAYSLKISRSRSFRTDFEEQMLKSTFKTDYDGEGSRLDDLNIMEQEEPEDEMLETDSVTIRKKDIGSWERRDGDEDEDEKHYATTPPRFNFPADLGLQPDSVMVATPRSNHRESVIAATPRSSHLESLFLATPHSNHVESDEMVDTINPMTKTPMAKTPKKLGRLTPIRLFHGTLPNSPNTMNLMNEQDPAFVRSLNVRRFDSIDIGSRSATPAARPVSFQHLKSDGSESSGAEQPSSANLNNRSNSTRKRYLTFVNKLRGRVED